MLNQGGLDLRYGQQYQHAQQNFQALGEYIECFGCLISPCMADCTGQGMHTLHCWCAAALVRYSQVAACMLLQPVAGYKHAL